MNSHYKTERTEPVRYVGLDVSKARLDYVIEAGPKATVANTAEGIAILVQRLREVPGARVVCEATGGYERALLGALWQEQIGVCRVSPSRVRHYAKAEGLRAKSDDIDRHLICRYARNMHPRLEKPVPAEGVLLRELVDYRRHLSERLIVTRNRQEVAGPTLQALLAAEQTQLETAMGEAEQAIQRHLQAHEALQTKSRRLQQMQGVGPILAVTLLAYLPELGHESDKRIAALVGVVPDPNQSGHSDKPRHISGGRSEVRTVLYMAAVSATQHNPVLSAFYQRLRDNGKPPKLCLTAVMRKMITVLNRLLRDPNFSLAS